MQVGWVGGGRGKEKGGRGQIKTRRKRPRLNAYRKRRRMIAAIAFLRAIVLALQTSPDSGS